MTDSGFRYANHADIAVVTNPYCSDSARRARTAAPRRCLNALDELSLSRVPGY